MIQYIFVILGFLIGIRGIFNLRSWKSNNESKFVSNSSGVKRFFEILRALHRDILKCKLIFNKISNFGIQILSEMQQMQQCWNKFSIYLLLNTFLQ